MFRLMFLTRHSITMHPCGTASTTHHRQAKDTAGFTWRAEVGMGSDTAQLGDPQSQFMPVWLAGDSDRHDILRQKH